MASCTEILTRKPKNIAIATNPAHELNVLESEIPEPGPDDCLVHVRATGICGSDVHFWKHGNIGDSVITKDCGLGHESSGIVIKTGSNVKTFNIGKSCVSSLITSFPAFTLPNIRPCHRSSQLTTTRRPRCVGVRHTLFKAKLRRVPHRTLQWLP
jgi:threonine dehydrogenase-like Zn-dependent dehydrogenase